MFIGTDLTSRVRFSAMVGTLVLLALAAVSLLTSGASAGPGVDLKVEKSDSPDPVDTGSRLTYTIRVTNLGGTPATEVVVRDKLPNGVDFRRASTTQGDCNRSGRIVRCELGTLNPAATATVEIRVRPKEGGEITNTATVKAQEPDPVPANNQATETTRVIQAPSCGGKAPTIVGTPGDDEITGTEGRDIIVTFGGSDEVDALGGKDAICGGRGGDLLKGGTNDDLVKGGRGPDTVKGGRGADTVKGANGRDKVRGGGGDDTVKGGRKADNLRGGGGNDLLNGGPGRDRCRGGPGNDTLKNCER